MDVAHIVAPHLIPHLSYGFKERQPLDVAYCPPNLHNDDFSLARPRQVEHVLLDCVGYMRDGLNRAAEKFSLSLARNNILVYLAGSEI